MTNIKKYVSEVAAKWCCVKKVLFEISENS